MHPFSQRARQLLPAHRRPKALGANNATPGGSYPHLGLARCPRPKHHLAVNQSATAHVEGSARSHFERNSI